MSFLNSYQSHSPISLEGLVYYLSFDEQTQYLGPKMVQDFGPNNLASGWSGASAYVNMPVGANTTSGTTGFTNWSLGASFGGSSMITAATHSDFAGSNKKLSAFFWTSRNTLSITPGDVAYVSMNWDAVGVNGWRVVTREAGHDIIVTIGNTSALISNTTPQRSTAHIGFTYDGANIKVYKNGKQIGSNVAATDTLVAGPLFLARHGGATPSWFTGYIDDFCIFNRNLTAAEVSAIYSSDTKLSYVTATTFFNYDEDVDLWCSSLSATPSTYIRQNLSTMVKKLKTAGVWNKLDRLWIFGMPDVQQANRCLRTRLNLTVVGTPTWTANSCYSGFTTANYLNTGFAGNAGTAYTQNSASVGVYSLANTNANVVDIGATAASAGDGTHFNSKNSTAVQTVKINANATGSFTVNATGIGFNAASRINSTTTNGYKYGGLLTTTLANASVAPSSNNMFIGCRNNNGTPDLAATNRQYAMAFIGGGLTSLEMDQFAQAIQIFGNTMGWSQTTQ